MNKPWISVFYLLLLLSIITQDLTSILKMQVGNISMYIAFILVSFILLFFKKDKFSIIVMITYFILILSSLFSYMFNFDKTATDFFQLIKLNSIFIFIILGYIFVRLRDFLNVLLKTYTLLIVILFIQNTIVITGLSKYVRVLNMDFLFLEIETGNLFAVFLVIIVFVINYFFLLKNNITIRKTVTLILLVFVNISTIILLISINSRTSFVIYCLMIVFFSIRQLLLSSKKKIMFNIILVSLIISSIIVLGKVTPAWDRLMYTFSNGSNLDNSSLARLYVSGVAIDHLTESPIRFLFGTGFQDFKAHFYGYTLNSPHNGFLNMAYKVGFLYLGIFVSFLIYLTLKLKGNFLKLLSVLLLIMVFMGSVTADIFNYLPIMQFYCLFIGVLFGYEKEILIDETVTSEFKEW